MKAAVGPWGIGAQAAHYLLILLCYRYNMSTLITRAGAYDFGHCEHYLIDRIQIRVREIFNVLIYPRHKNIMEFEGNEDFVAVGIGPLCYSEDFVTKGEPDERLVGDMRFIAKRSGIKHPPLPIRTKDEINIFTQFMATNKATQGNFIKLAKLYKMSANGINIFPKLPTMLKSYYNR